MALFTTAVRADDITNADTEETDPQNQSKVTTFVTQQSLTYPVALVIVGALWLGAQRLGTWGASPWVPLVLAIVIVGVGVLTTWDDIQSGSKRGAAILLAIINAGLLFVGTIGIDLTKVGEELGRLGGG